MKALKKLGLWAVLFASTTVLAQVDIQKFHLKNLSYEWLSSQQGPGKRCANYLPLEDRSPTLQYTDEGQAFLEFEIKVRLETQNCPLKSMNPEVIKAPRVETDPQGNSVAVFPVRLVPPVAVAYVEGPGFRDQLVFEAPIERLRDVSFFDFFKRSKVHFETRYSTLTTDNPLATTSEAKVFPVFGGHIGVPFPWLKNLVVGYTLYQNLGNFMTDKANAIHLSEFGFDLRWLWRGRESMGRPELSAFADYRARSVYQANADKPFLLGSMATIGGGIEGLWFFGALAAPWDSPMSRVGVSGSVRYYPRLVVEEAVFSSLATEAGLHYRLSRKWALGAGGVLSYAFGPVQGTDVKEYINSVYLRLTLIPFIEELYR